jgi:predicted transcriptional regulator
MLKKKIHRLPIVNQDKQVIGKYQNDRIRTAIIYSICIILNFELSMLQSFKTLSTGIVTRDDVLRKLEGLLKV